MPWAEWIPNERNEKKKQVETLLCTQLRIKNHLESRLEQEIVVAMTITMQRTNEVTKQIWKTKQICRARRKNENHEEKKMRSKYEYYAA